jgi:hypothetical protein
MFRSLIFVVGLLSLLLTASCGSMPGPMEGVERRVDVTSALPTDFSADKYLLVKELSKGGHAVFFYQDNEGYTHFYNGSDDRIINRELIDKYKKLGAVPLAMSYGFDGKSVYFSQPVKWEKKKQIVIKLEPGGKILFNKELSELGQVMRPASFAFDGKGNTLMTWIDETPPRVKAIYTVMAADGSVGKEEMIADDTDAMLYVEPVYTARGYAIVYSRTGVAGQRDSEIHLKRLADGSDTVLYHGTDVSGFDLIEVDGAYALRPYQPGESGKVLTFNSSFEPTASYALPYPKEIGGAFGVTDALTLTGKGPVVVGGGVPPSGVSMDGLSLPQKSALYVSAAGKPFEPLVDGIPHMFTSEMPVVENIDKNVVVGFSDRRFATVTPMLAVVDYDGNLVKRDVALESPQVRTGKMQLVKIDGDTIRAFYPVNDPSRPNWIYRFTDLSISKMQGHYTLPATAERQQKLFEKAQEYAACRLKGDYQCIYDMLDPTYRGGISKLDHEQRMKSLGVTLTGYKVEKCKVMADSILGECEGEISAKLPAVLMGKPISETQREVKQTIAGEIWVYVNGNWYYAVSIPMLGYAIQW